MKHELGGINRRLWCIRTCISPVIILAFATYAIRNTFVLNVFEKDRFAVRLAYIRAPSVTAIFAGSDLQRWKVRGRIGPEYLQTTEHFFQSQTLYRKLTEM